MSDIEKRGLRTRIARAGRETDAAGPVTVSPPMRRGSTVLMPDVASLYGEARTYGLDGFEAHDALRAALADISGGCGTALVPSGLAACTIPMLAYAAPGAEILVPDTVYGPTRRFCDGLLKRLGARTRYYDPRETVGFSSDTTLLFLESPGSLTFEVQDIPALAAAARSAGVATAIDDTWSAGVLFRPLDHGIDYSCQALTKHQGGHSDLLLGAVVAREPDGLARIARTIRDLGLGSGAAEDVSLALRGLRTMLLRLEAQGRAGLSLAAWLERHPAVKRVLHPGLPSHPDHTLFARDFTGSAGVFSIVLHASYGETVVAALERLELFGLGFSWAGFESLIIPCDPQIFRTATRWTETGALLRLSIGLEDEADLRADLDQALSPLTA